ncbi:type IV secretion system protein [Paracoccus benzoatiresistens]|uniref:Type IV secretion system protein n=1 Tax=Paracoccus benzoatiresistens TaxID=2997341 RepID=A0ABT4J724_9RHOB|nr:type IV secretion system protein [Paracoccus sp. EF6]MCZ0962931.1 type IV secretion system protein [Paracoccus sp. EF6]
MSAVQLIVGSAESFLTNAARSTFLGLVEASGTLVGYMAVLAVALVGINMMLQLLPMTWGHALSLMIKLALIGIFAWNWNQFWAVAGGIQKAIEATAGGILASSGDGLSGPTIADGFATAIDDMMDKFTVAATNIAAEMGGWFVTAIVSGICLLLIGTISAVAAVLILFPKVVITVLLGLAPIVIALTLFEATKGFFERWVSACVSWSLYPLFIASIFSIMISMGTDLVDRIGTSNFASIGAFVPFIVLMILILLCMALLPSLVSSVSGNMQMMGLAAVGLMAGRSVGSYVGGARNAASAIKTTTQAAKQTYRGESAIARGSQAFVSHPTVSQATTGVAESINRMQAKARALAKK